MSLTNIRRETALHGLWHDFANLFPMLDAAAQDALRADIQAFGVREPVILFDGRILDGRNRYMAARDLGLDFPVADFDGTEAEALAYVLSTNLHRRHLTESQRAAVAAKLANMKREDTLVNFRSANLPITENIEENRNQPAISNAKAAEMLNVSERSVRTAKSVLDHGAPELMAAVERGEVAVSAAAAIAELPKEEQAAVVAEGSKAVKAKAKEVREAKRAEAPEENPEDAKARRDLAKLTRTGLEDEVIGLRAENAELRAKIKELKAEAAAMKEDLAAFKTDDLGRALGNAQRQARTAEGRMKEYQATAVRADRRAKILEAEVKKLRAEIENTMIPLN